MYFTTRDILRVGVRALREQAPHPHAFVPTGVLMHRALLRVEAAIDQHPHYHTTILCAAFGRLVVRGRL